MSFAVASVFTYFAQTLIVIAIIAMMISLIKFNAVARPRNFLSSSLCAQCMSRFRLDSFPPGLCVNNAHSPFFIFYVIIKIDKGEVLNGKF